MRKVVHRSQLRPEDVAEGWCEDIEGTIRMVRTRMVKFTFCTKAEPYIEKTWWVNANNVEIDEIYLPVPVAVN